MNSMLIATYEAKRQGFLIGFAQNPDRFDPALAYAYENRIAPIFHEEIARETYKDDPFKDVYAVKAAFAKEVIKYVDECWRAKNLQAVAFYKLEDKFGGHHEVRMELIHVLEYARISKLFDDDLYAAVESNAPSEANQLDATFSPTDVYFN